MSPLVGSLFAALPQAEGCDVNSVIISLSYTEFISVVIIGFIGLYLSVKVIKAFGKRLHLFKIIVPTSYNGNSYLNILLEFNSGGDKLLLYLCTLKADFSSLSTPRPITIEDLSFSHKYIYGKLSINWKNSDFQLFHNKMIVRLPTALYVAPYKLFTMKKLINKKCADWRQCVPSTMC